MTNWHRYTLTKSIPVHRQGWPGVWDALVAAVTRRPRVTVETPMTESAWIKPTPFISPFDPAATVNLDECKTVVCGHEGNLVVYGADAVKWLILNRGKDYFDRSKE